MCFLPEICPRCVRGVLRFVREVCPRCASADYRVTVFCILAQDGRKNFSHFWKSFVTTCTLNKCLKCILFQKIAKKEFCGNRRRMGEIWIGRSFRLFRCSKMFAMAIFMQEYYGVTYNSKMLTIWEDCQKLIFDLVAKKSLLCDRLSFI
jgi:hypothetical protein